MSDFNKLKFRQDGTASLLAPPAGVIWPFAGATAPNGYLFATGQVVAIADYPDLYEAIGITYNTGGEGVGNFRLPDPRERVIVGRSTAASAMANSGIHGVNVTSLGNKGGVDAHTLTGAQSGVPVHTHQVTDPGHLHGSGFVTAATGGSGSAVRTLSSSPGNNTGSSVTNISVNSTAAANASAAHTNVQPSIVLNYIIKY